MKFDLKNLNPGVFFPFEDDEDEGGVTIRLANGKVIDEIEKVCTKKKVVFKKGQRHEVIVENKELRTKMLWDYVICEWSGLFDSEGRAIECTKENKELLMQSSVKFSAFIGNCVEQLSADVELYEEELEKNL